MTVKSNISGHRSDTITPERTRPIFYRLIWLLPAIFSAHIVEEYAGGFPSWVTNVVGGSFSNLAFALNNAAFMALMLLATLWASRSRSSCATFVLIAWSSGNIFWDSLFHVGTTAALDRYSPGLVTSSILYLPLSLMLGWTCVRDRALGPRAFVCAVIAGLLLFAFVAWYGLFHFAI